MGIAWRPLIFRAVEQLAAFKGPISRAAAPAPLRQKSRLTVQPIQPRDKPPGQAIARRRRAASRSAMNRDTAAGTGRWMLQPVRLSNGACGATVAHGEDGDVPRRGIVVERLIERREESGMATGLYLLQDGTIMVAYGARKIPLSPAQYKANGYRPPFEKLKAKATDADKAQRQVESARRARPFAHH
jgi:hypothetical protein